MILDHFTFFAAIIVLFLVPGFTLTRILRSPSNAITILPYSVFSGFFIFAFLAPIAFLLHLRWEVLIAVHILTVSILWIYFILRRVYRFHFRIERGDLIFWGFVLLAFGFAFWKGRYQDGDAWYHIAQANFYSNSQYLRSGNAYYENQAAGTVYDYNAYHLFLAYLSKITRLDLSIIWVNLFPLFFVVSLLALYGIVRQFADHRQVSYYFISVLLLTALTGKGPSFWSTIAIHNNLCMWALNPLIIHLLISSSTEGQKCHCLIQFFVLTYALSSIHIFNYVYLFIQISLIFAVALFISIKSKRIWEISKEYSLMLSTYLISGSVYALLIYITSRSEQPPDSFPGTPLQLVHIS